MAALEDTLPATASAYLPHESEIDSRPLLAALADAGWRTALPVVVGKARPLVFRAWRDGDALERGVYGIPVPGEGAEAVRPSVVFVPMLAFDAHGFRLGYGGGFYDRTLARLRADGPLTAIGVAYAAQQVEKCPTDAYDQPLDLVVTEAGPVTVGPERAAIS